MTAPTIRRRTDASQNVPPSESHHIDSDGVSLFARSWGQRYHPALVLVHGYPDNHLVWQPVAEQLAARFYVIAYDVRGAGRSDAPRSVSAYRMAQLSRDLQAVVDALIPGQPFHLAGHDWGSIQSWESVTSAPLARRILSYSSISGPCLDHMGYWLRRRLTRLSLREQRQVLRQLLSSWYIVLFQLPMLAPMGWRLGVGKYWPWFLRQVEKVTEPGDNPSRTRDGLHGINLYRANFPGKLLTPETRHTQVPVQLIVPTRDYYVGGHLFDDLHHWVPELYRRDIDARHWVSLSHSSEVADWLGEFAEAVAHGDQDTRFASLRVNSATAARAA